jgi:hypothetical protein
MSQGWGQRLKAGLCWTSACNAAGASLLQPMGTGRQAQPAPQSGGLFSSDANVGG